jgi:hypothetical protein
MAERVTFQGPGGSTAILDLRFADYARAGGDAVKKAFQIVQREMVRRAKALAPRAARHRKDRLYPSGYREKGAFRDMTLRQSITGKSGMDRRQRYFALAKARLGYGVFQEYGTKKSAARRFLRGARDEVLSRAVSTIQAKWPK